MSFRILQDLPAEKLNNAIPSAYRGMTDSIPGMGSSVTLVLFRASKGDVILSRTAHKALGRVGVPNGETRIAIGGCFTTEAESALRKAGFHVLGLSELHWTDDAYMSLRGKPRDVDMDS